MIINRKNERRLRRKRRIRNKIIRHSDRPRLNVYRSLKHIYAQIIDDRKGHTLVSASTVDREIREMVKDVKGKVEQSRIVGKVLAQRALQAGIKQVAFDRNGYKYHGRVKALADGAREGGLEF